MAPSPSSAHVTLSYPLYAADFDPFNSDFLLVAGGGGSSSTGVPNKISLIDVSPRTQLSEVVDVELSKTEDSVTSLAVADSSPASLTAFAGINSSVADQAAGKNEHLRCFRIALPPRKRRADGISAAVPEKQPAPPASPPTQPLGRTALFSAAKGSKIETYQRVLRFTPTKAAGTPRLAAAASGLAPDNEIVVFRPAPTPSPRDEVSRIRLGGREAADLDLRSDTDNNNGGGGSSSKISGAQTTEKTSRGHLLAYCDDGQVFLQVLPQSSKPAAPSALYKTPETATSAPASKRPRFRALRFLTPHHLILLQNRPGRTGADLLVLRLTKDKSQAQLTLRKKLHKSTRAAVGLDVAALTESDRGETQFIVAVAGQTGDDSSIEILTIDYAPSTGLGTFRPYTLLRGVHNGPLTRLVFSNFVGPALPVTAETGPQAVRLASVGVDMKVVVHHLPLRPFPTSATKRPRYVLIPPGRSEAVQTTFSVFFAIVVVGLVALCMQAFCEIRGAVPPLLGAPDWLSPRARHLLARPYVGDRVSHAVTSDLPVAAHSAADRLRQGAADLQQSLADLVAENSDLETPKAIILRDDGAGDVSTHLAHDVDLVKEETLKKWEELTEEQKHSWRRKLVDAGHWAEHQGESVLMGVLFSELAGVVGNMVAG